MAKQKKQNPKKRLTQKEARDTMSYAEYAEFVKKNHLEDRGKEMNRLQMFNQGINPKSVDRFTRWENKEDEQFDLKQVMKDEVNKRGGNIHVAEGQLKQLWDLRKGNDIYSGLKKKNKRKINLSEGAGMPEMNLGGWIKENKQGVMGGLSVLGGAALMATGVGGPFGAGLITSGVGGITNEIQQDAAANQQATDAIHAQGAQASTANTPTFKFGGKYKRMANGGLVEWQGGEPLMTPGGKIVRTPKSMPSHKDGGVVGEVEQGTAFLGEMINPETGNKYMDDGNKLGKIQSKADRILGTSRTSRSRNAALLNKKNASMKFDGWVKQQEMLKPKTKQTNIPKAQWGIDTDVPPTMSAEEYLQFQKGSDSFGTDVSPYLAKPQGPINQHERWKSVYGQFPQEQNTQQFDYNPNVGQGVGSANQYRTLNDNDQIIQDQVSTATSGATGTPSSNTGATMNAPSTVKPPMTFNLNSVVDPGTGDTVNRLPLEEQDFTAGIPNDTIDPTASGQGTGVITTPGQQGGDFMNKYGSTIAALAPVAFNAISALMPSEKEKLPGQYASANALLANRRFNIRPLLRQNRITQKIGDYNAKVRGGGSMYAQRQANMAGRMGSDMQAEATRQQMDNQYMAEQAQGLFGTGAAQRQVDEANLMNQAARRNMLGASLSQFSNFSQNRELMNNQAQRDRQRDFILERTFPAMMNKYYSDYRNII